MLFEQRRTDLFIVGQLGQKTRPVLTMGRQRNPSRFVNVRNGSNPVMRDKSGADQ